MKFTFAETAKRYRVTLAAMEPGKAATLGDNWATAALAFYFGSDRERATLSVRNTLTPMLREDNRVLDNETMRQLLASIALEKAAQDVAGQIHDTYIASTPKQ